jgi:ParB-like chromosome segregation protein Spo0J
MKPPKKPYSYHACLAFPMMSQAELQALAEDLRQQGQLHPVVMYRGQVLDGRNRLVACEIAGVEPRFVE